jgi:Mg2+-importing ATPase
MTSPQPWSIPLPGLLADLVETLGGLTCKEAQKRLVKYGPNDALARRRRPLRRQVLDRFSNPLVLILLLAAGLSAWTGQVASFVIITFIILLSVVLDLVQQLRAENSVEALRRSLVSRSHPATTLALTI